MMWNCLQCEPKEKRYIATLMVTVPMEVEVWADGLEEAMEKITNEDFVLKDDIDRIIYKDAEIEEVTGVREED